MPKILFRIISTLLVPILVWNPVAATGVISEVPNPVALTANHEFLIEALGARAFGFSQLPLGVAPGHVRNNFAIAGISLLPKDGSSAANKVPPYFSAILTVGWQLPWHLKRIDLAGNWTSLTDRIANFIGPASVWLAIGTGLLLLTIVVALRIARRPRSSPSLDLEWITGELSRLAGEPVVLLPKPALRITEALAAGIGSPKNIAEQLYEGWNQECLLKSHEVSPTSRQQQMLENANKAMQSYFQKRGVPYIPIVAHWIDTDIWRKELRTAIGLTSNFDGKVLVPSAHQESELMRTFLHEAVERNSVGLGSHAIDEGIATFIETSQYMDAKELPTDDLLEVIKYFYSLPAIPGWGMLAYATHLVAAVHLMREFGQEQVLLAYLTGKGNPIREIVGDRHWQALVRLELQYMGAYGDLQKEYFNAVGRWIRRSPNRLRRKTLPAA